MLGNAPHRASGGLLVRGGYSHAARAARRSPRTSVAPAQLLSPTPPTRPTLVPLQARPVKTLVEHAAKALPHQGILENFVHHNPLHDFEQLTFTDALEWVDHMESFQSPGELLLLRTGVDPRKRTNAAVSDLSAVFLDRGAAKWAPRFRDRGFLHFFATLETVGMAPWRRHARKVARRIVAADVSADNSVDLSDIIIKENLDFFGVPPADWEPAMQSMLTELRGWAGMFHRMQTHPGEAPPGAAVHLLDFAAVKSILLRSSVESIARECGWRPGSGKSYASWLGTRPLPGAAGNYDGPGVSSSRSTPYAGSSLAADEGLPNESLPTAPARPSNFPFSMPFPSFNRYQLLPAIDRRSRKRSRQSVQASSSVASSNQSMERRVELETDFERSLLRAVALPPPVDPACYASCTTCPSPQDAICSAVTEGTSAPSIDPGTAKPVASPPAPGVRPRVQLYTCIDDRQCSIRRHFESESSQIGDPHGVETFGIAGFFGLPFRFRAAGTTEEILQAPAGLDASTVLIEAEDAAHPGELREFLRRRRQTALLSEWWENASFSPFGSLALSTLFPLSLARLWLMGFSPVTKQRLRDALRGALLPTPHTDFELPMPVHEAAALLAPTLVSAGAHERFAPIVVVMGHGAASANNPFAAAYQCGACSGHAGGPNARLFARLANNAEVRTALAAQHGIAVPDDTVFVGATHNTTADVVEFFDELAVPASHAEHLAHARSLLQRACGANALERCQRFLLAADVTTAEAALRHVLQRSVDPAEVRPELNHAANAAVVVGRRQLTRGRSLQCRAFLPSYDPNYDDDRGTRLESVLGPALVVCSGINLEYLFSTISADRHGAGTKSPLNVVGNIGVLQGSTGDLRPGLPSQMTEMHVPLRALFVIDAPVARVEAVLSRREDLRRLVHNEWVRCVVRDPATGQFFRFQRFEGDSVAAAPPAGTFRIPPPPNTRSSSDGDPPVGAFIPLPVPAPVLDPDGRPDSVPEPAWFLSQREHGLRVVQREAAAYWAATAGMIASCAVPIHLYADASMNPYGVATALSATALALPVLSFSRRYMHGEFLFPRFAALGTGLVLGFNLVATSPGLEHTLAGWSLFGFSSAFLIGSYNDRPSVRDNATFAFAAYRVSDMALLCASAFAGVNGLDPSGCQYPQVVAGGLLLAALYKSSQFPLTALFARSMEGPTPMSALGYAGVSAHVGVILLGSTMPLWFPFDWARLALAGTGLYTAAYSGVMSKVLADRKGSLAYATSATLGLIYATLAAGYLEAALLMSLGHASFRIIQILRAPGIIGDTKRLHEALGDTLAWPRAVPDNLYRAAWALHRIDTDFHLLHTLHRITAKLRFPTLEDWSLPIPAQWALTGLGAVIAGFPFTPMNHAYEELVVDLLHTNPAIAAAVMASHTAVSVLTVSFLMASVLNTKRPPELAPPPDKPLRHDSLALRGHPTKRADE